MASLIDFINFISYSDDIQMLALEQLAKKWPFSAGGGVVRPLLLNITEIGQRL